MTPQTKGNGRFLENLPASLVKTYLVLDAEDGTVGMRLMAAIADSGGADIVVGVDTGGDALHSSTVEDYTQASPDQDLRVLQALCALKDIEVVTLVLAVGIDSPDNAAEILLRAKAFTVEFDETAIGRILSRYNGWTAEAQGGFLGKTPLAWCGALEGKTGVMVLDIPVSRVIARHNPWNPFVLTNPSMAMGFVMDANRQLAAITQT